MRPPLEGWVPRWELLLSFDKGTNNLFGHLINLLLAVFLQHNSSSVSICSLKLSLYRLYQEV